MARGSFIGYAAAGFAALLFTQPANAQDGSTAEAAGNYLESLKSCQAIETDAERLKCYDTAVGRVVAASEEGEVRLVDREDVKKTRRRLFGFSIPDLGIFGGGDEEDMDLLQSKVTRIVSTGRKSVTFEIEEGSVWTISDTPARVMRRLEPGASVEFKKAALGSFFIRVEGLTGVKGRRVQ